MVVKFHVLTCCAGKLLLAVLVEIQKIRVLDVCLGAVDVLAQNT